MILTLTSAAAVLVVVLRWVVELVTFTLLRAAVTVRLTCVLSPVAVVVLALATTVFAFAVSFTVVAGVSICIDLAAG